MGPQLDKYLAAQGYCVFDIQYGIYEWDLLSQIDPVTPRDAKGNFTITDMVRHIGIFCKYLTNHSEEYGANLDSVFVSGGSAGGHLTMATALGIWSNKYTSYFGTNLTIKGMIPIYPANGMMEYFGIGGSETLNNPENLINSSSIPCLILQGTHDVLNMFSVAQNIKNLYTTNNVDECAIIWLHEGGHAADLYFNGYHNQIMLYFMERFLYLYH